MVVRHHKMIVRCHMTSCVSVISQVLKLCDAARSSHDGPTTTNTARALPNEVTDDFPSSFHHHFPSSL